MFTSVQENRQQRTRQSLETILLPNHAKICFIWTRYDNTRLDTSFVALNVKLWCKKMNKENGVQILCVFLPSELLSTFSDSETMETVCGRREQFR